MAAKQSIKPYLPDLQDPLSENSNWHSHSNSEPRQTSQSKHVAEYGGWVEVVVFSNIIRFSKLGKEGDSRTCSTVELDVETVMVPSFDHSI